MADFRGTKRFEVISHLGSGGFGVVYEVFDRRDKTRVALKTLHGVDASSLLSFKNEFRSLAGLHHPNLVSLGELLEIEGRWFFTMELVEGVDFIEYVRGTRTVNRGATIETPREEVLVNQTLPTHELDALTAAGKSSNPVIVTRLRRALLHLSGGLLALHRAGFVHRDVKPSNIRVTREGRVVLLDFGLLAQHATGERPDVRGTVAYMAPERFSGNSALPTEDVYALGVLLYNALTGRVPFEGDFQRIVTSKQHTDPVPPRALVEGVPWDLNDLCLRLLARAPSGRPDLAAVVDELSAGDRVSSAGTVYGSDEPFVGRESELRQLRVALDETRHVLIVGESGIGKTALVNQASANVADALVLTGRCYERELIPFNAIDAIVDGLAVAVKELPPLSADASAALGTAFPVLRPLLFEHGGTPALDRGVLLGAVRTLLHGVAEARPILITIDDLQWADGDSLAMLEEILRPPITSPIALLATSRVREVDMDVKLDILELGPLPPEDSDALARLLSDDEVKSTRLGNPLAIVESMRHAHGADSLGMDQQLEIRVGRLGNDDAELLELVCLANTPLSLAVAERALEWSDATLQGAMARLETESLVRRVEFKGQHATEAFHARIGELVRRNLQPERRVALSRLLAEALEADVNTDPETLAIQWYGAGETSKAASYALDAGDRAAAKLAFERAAAFYRLSLEFGHYEGRQLGDIQHRIADAFTGAGKGHEAALAYRDAAACSTGINRQALLRQSAAQFMRSGYVDEGLRVLDTVLASSGLRMPRSTAGALIGTLARRALIRLRAYRFTERAAEDVPSERLERIDVLWMASSTISMLDIWRAGYFQARLLHAALIAGEPVRLSLALCQEANFLALTARGPGGRHTRVLQKAETLARKTQDEEALGWATAARGFAMMIGGRFEKALPFLDEAVETARNFETGAAWEAVTTELFSFHSLILMGELAELNDRMARMLRDAELRGDVYAASFCRVGPYIMHWLTRDDPEGAWEAVESVSRQWPSPSYFMWEVMARTMIELYRDEPGKAWERLRSAWPGLRRRLMLRVPFFHAQLLYLRGCAALRAGIRDDVVQVVSRLERLRLNWVSPQALVLRAGLENDPHALATAAAEFDAVGMNIYAAGCRWHVPDTKYKAIAVMRKQNVANPEKLARLFVPF